MKQFVSSISAELQQQLDAIRDRKKLSLIPVDNEGAALGTLPDNIFGFTSSPVNESTPLFARRIFQCFEVHKLAGGVVHILGFVTPQQAAGFQAGKDSLDFHLFPEPHGEATAMIELPLERISKSRALSRSDGNYMPVSVDPA
jgi:hypothetical protein